MSPNVIRCQTPFFSPPAVCLEVAEFERAGFLFDGWFPESQFSRIGPHSKGVNFMYGPLQRCSNFFYITERVFFCWIRMWCFYLWLTREIGFLRHGSKKNFGSVCNAKRQDRPSRCWSGFFSCHKHGLCKKNFSPRCCFMHGITKKFEAS